MLVLLSPAKKLDLDAPLPDFVPSPWQVPKHHSLAMALVEKMKGYSASEIGELMGLSEKLSQLNYTRYQNFPTSPSSPHLRPALYMFKGDTYVGLDVENLIISPQHLDYAQDHLLILSGLYGLLRPLDGVGAYRLEMSTSLAIGTAKNLYEYWKVELTQSLKKRLGPEGVVVNAASKEYIKAIDEKVLGAKMVHVHFKEQTPQGLKTIGLMAKKARGNIAHYILKNKLQRPEDLRRYTGLGYAYCKRESDPTHFVFTRKKG